MAQLDDPKHEKFAQEYCTDFNGAQAAIRAGYAKRSARVTASRLLSNANIMARVKELATKDITKVEMNRERILRELSFLGTVDIAEAYDDNGNLLPINEMPEGIRRAIAGIELIEERDENGEPTGTMTKKVKFWDKNTSLLGLARVFKMLTDKVEHDHKVTLESFLGGTWPDEQPKKGKEKK